MAAVAGLAVCGAVDARAQTDTSGLHASLDGWAERTWLAIVDRDAVEGGRTGAAGILQRFHARLDEEHELDLVSARFGLTDDFAWYRSDNGLRYWGGSINPAEMVDGLDVRARVRIAPRWSMRAAVNLERQPQLDRHLLRIGFEHTWAGGFRTFFGGTLLPNKPGADLLVGGGWRVGAADVQLTLAALDPFTDFIYQTLGVPTTFPIVLDYEQHPYAAQARADVPVGPVRIEAHAAYMRPAVVRGFAQLLPDQGFRQRETFGYAGGLLEVAATSRVRVGLTARYEAAGLDRAPLAAGAPEDDFVLEQSTGSAGGFALAWLGRGWSVESWVYRNSRPERRTYRAGVGTDVDYLDRAWTGRFRVRRMRTRGFLIEATVDADRRDTVRGRIDTAYPFIIHNYRLRGNFGWRWGAAAWFTVGAGFDLDGDNHYGGRRFDGARTQLVLAW